MEKEQKTPEQIQHESNKVVRENLAFAHYTIQTRQYLPEQFTDVTNCLNVLHALCTDLQKKIELVEPPTPIEPTEPKAPYIMEAPPLAPEAMQ